MRKVRNHITNFNNPTLMYAQGIESLIAVPLMNPARHDHQELIKTKRISNGGATQDKSFSLLMRQFANLV